MKVNFGLSIPSAYYDTVEFQYYHQDAKRVRAGKKWVSTSGNFIIKNYLIPPTFKNFKFPDPPSSNPHKEIVQIQLKSGRYIHWLIEKHTAVNGDITITPFYEVELLNAFALKSPTGQPWGLPPLPDYYFYKRRA